MAEEVKSPGTRRGEILVAEIRLAASRNNDLCIAFIETAKRIAAEYPDMPPHEKQAHYAALKQKMDTMNVSTKQDCTHVLGEILRILGISSK